MAPPIPALLEWVAEHHEVRGFPGADAIPGDQLLTWDADGRELAMPRPTNTSGDFSSLAATDGFIELAAGTALRERGTTGRIFRW